MKITKFVHACLLVEGEQRVGLFDPGVYSYPAFDIAKLAKLDDILITHNHQDHIYMPFVKDLVAKFPNTRITAPSEVVDQLKSEGISATSSQSEGIRFFNSPHESTEPLFPIPQEIGIHYLDKISHPGDSHSFNETKEILALPMTAPWGASIKALNLALELKPKYVIPIHDWHWHEEARKGMYQGFKNFLEKQGISFFEAETGQPIDIN